MLQDLSPPPLSLESYACLGAWSTSCHRVDLARHPDSVQGSYHRHTQVTIFQLQTPESILHHVRLEVCVCVCMFVESELINLLGVSET